MENSFQTIGWEKDLSVQNLFENPWMDCGVPRCRYESGEVGNGDFLKNAHCVFVL